MSFYVLRHIETGLYYPSPEYRDTAGCAPTVKGARKFAAQEEAEGVRSLRWYPKLWEVVLVSYVVRWTPKDGAPWFAGCREGSPWAWTSSRSEAKRFSSPEAARAEYERWLQKWPPDVTPAGKVVRLLKRVA